MASHRTAYYWSKRSVPLAGSEAELGAASVGFLSHSVAEQRHDDPSFLSHRGAARCVHHVNSLSGDALIGPLLEAVQSEG